MAQFLRRDPYKAFRYRVSWRYQGSFQDVAGVSQVSSLTQSTTLISYRLGEESNFMKKAPGQTSYTPVTLMRGLTANRQFHDWAKKLDPYDTSSVEYDLDFRKDVRITLYDENGNPSVFFTLNNCWVQQYKGLPDLNTENNGIAIEQLILEHEGWEDQSWTLAGRDSTL